MGEDKSLQFDFVVSNKKASRTGPKPALRQLTPVSCSPHPARRNEGPLPCPTPSASHWDTYDGPRAYPSRGIGTEDKRSRLIELLEEMLARAKGEHPGHRRDLRSITWPFTKIGLMALDVIFLSDEIADELRKQCSSKSNQQHSNKRSS